MITPIQRRNSRNPSGDVPGCHNGGDDERYLVRGEFVVSEQTTVRREPDVEGDVGEADEGTGQLGRFHGVADLAPAPYVGRAFTRFRAVNAAQPQDGAVANGAVEFQLGLGCLAVKLPVSAD